MFLLPYFPATPFFLSFSLCYACASTLSYYWQQRLRGLVDLTRQGGLNGSVKELQVMTMKNERYRWRTTTQSYEVEVAHETLHGVYE